jgi:Phage-related protein
MTVKELINKAGVLLGIGNINTSPDGAIALSAVYSCIKAISETIGMLPLNHYLATDEGRVLINNKLTQKVAVRPNNYTTASDFYQAIIANALLYGNGYAVIYREPDGSTVRSLQVVPSYFVDPKFADGNVTYDVTIPISDSQQVVKKIPQMDIIHLKGVGFDNIKGKSPVEYAAEAYGFALSAQKYGAEFFKKWSALKRLY